MAGRGRGRGGRGGFGASRELPPMGLTFADIQAMSREQTALYPPMRPPVLREYTDSERKITQLQIGFARRLRNSQYYVVETTKNTELPKYSDKYRPSVSAQPKLKRQDLNPAFFPTEIFEGYFNPKKIKGRKNVAQKKRVNLDNMVEDEDEKVKSEDEGSGGSQAQASDYDAEEEYDNDYAYDYFDNGEGDDMDNLGDGGGGDEGGGGDYD